jgi:Cu-Zn family superoxide dismutase
MYNVVPEASVPVGGNDAGAAPMDSGSSGSDAGSTSEGGASDGGANSGDGSALAKSTGSWVVYDNPYGDGGANPAMGIQGTAIALPRKLADGGAGMEVQLMVSGLTPDRDYGSHIHKAECDAGMAGGHFQHEPAPDGGASDPAFANAMNEVWLDFKTDGMGKAMSDVEVDFVPPPGGAKAIIVHDRKTGDGGVAGPKLACLPFAF